MNFTLHLTYCFIADDINYFAFAESKFILIFYYYSRYWFYIFKLIALLNFSSLANIDKKREWSRPNISFTTFGVTGKSKQEEFYQSVSRIDTNLNITKCNIDIFFFYAFFFFYLNYLITGWKDLAHFQKFKVNFYLPQP